MRETACAEDVGQCMECSPLIAEEIARAQSGAHCRQCGTEGSPGAMFRAQSGTRM